MSSSLANLITAWAFIMWAPLRRTSLFAGQPSASPRVLLGRCGRSLCAEVATRRKNAFVLLGLEPGASHSEIKKKYYMLAKKTHPDVIAREAREAAERAAADVGPKVVHFGKNSSGLLEEDHIAAAAKPALVPFLEVQAAYDFLMQDDGKATQKQKGAVRAGSRQARPRTLGEVLCDRLRDEPEMHQELWEVRS